MRRGRRCGWISRSAICETSQGLNGDQRGRDVQVGDRLSGGVPLIVHANMVEKRQAGAPGARMAAICVEVRYGPFPYVSSWWLSTSLLEIKRGTRWLLRLWSSFHCRSPSELPCLRIHPRTFAFYPVDLEVLSIHKQTDYHVCQGAAETGKAAACGTVWYAMAEYN